MDKFKSKVGKNVIEMFMFSMYPDAKNIYREYVQNACDAIKDAVNKGVLTHNNEGHITISIDRNSNRIQISDNGIGIPRDSVDEILLNIADSHKDGCSMAGQYGVGRLVGAGYCKTLSFKTTFKGESVASEIIFDVEEARRILDDSEDFSSASEVIDAITSKKEYDADLDNHYFIVTLDVVRSDYPELLDSNVIVNYLKDVAPIDYGIPFKNNLMSASIPSDYKQLKDAICHYKISINNELDIRKRYGMRVEGTGDEIHTLEFFRLEDHHFGLLAWGWYAITPLSTAIPVSDLNRGIRLRKHNIQIGGCDILNQYFKEARGNGYFYGEVHLVNSKLKPEGSRSGLAPTPEAARFKSLIEDQFKSLGQLYQFANKAKNIAKEVSSINLNNDEDLSSEAVNIAEKKKEDVKNKLSDLGRNKNAQNNPAQKILDIYMKSIDVKSTNNSYNNTCSNHSSVKSNKHECVDLRDMLKGQYSEAEISLIKRIFGALTDNCPARNKKLIEELKNKVVKDLMR